MESMDLDMNDLFDRGGDDADNDGQDYGVHTGLPDLDLDEGVMRPQEDQNEGLICSYYVCIYVWTIGHHIQLCIYFCIQGRWQV